MSFVLKRCFIGLLFLFPSVLNAETFSLQELTGQVAGLKGSSEIVSAPLFNSGQDDLVVRSGNTVFVYKAKNGFSYELAFSTSVDGVGRSILVSDQDGDNSKDLVMLSTGSSSATITYWKNSGTSLLQTPLSFVADNDFVLTPLFKYPNGLPATLNLITNENGKGILGFFGGSYSLVGTAGLDNGQNIAVKNVSVPGIASTDSGPTTFSSSALVLAKQLWHPVTGSNGFAVFYDGNGYLRSSNGTVFNQTPLAMPKDIQVGDLDGDGKEDLLLSIPTDDSFDTKLLMISGSTYAQSYLPVVTTKSLVKNGKDLAFALGDLNQDGRLDVAVAVTTNSPSVPNDAQKIYWLNNASQSFSVQEIAQDSTACTHCFSQLNVGDLNGDNKVDLIIAGTNTKIFLQGANTGQISFSTATTLSDSTTSGGGSTQSSTSTTGTASTALSTVGLPCSIDIECGYQGKCSANLCTSGSKKYPNAYDDLHSGNGTPSSDPEPIAGACSSDLDCSRAKACIGGTCVGVPGLVCSNLFSDSNDTLNKLNQCKSGKTVPTDCTAYVTASQTALNAEISCRTQNGSNCHALHVTYINAIEEQTKCEDAKLTSTPMECSTELALHATNSLKTSLLGCMPPPTATGISPSNGKVIGGTLVTITGSGLLGGVEVKLGDQFCTDVTPNPDGKALTCRTPAHAEATVSVIITNPDGQSVTLSNAYTYIDPATILSVTPNSGLSTGNETITVSGSSFKQGATVLVGSASCASPVITPTSIECKTPPGTGTVNVSVTNPGATASTLPLAFTYRNAPPVITGVLPTGGSTSYDTPVTISGSGFLANALVTLGSATCKNVVVSSTQINCTAPAQSAGAVAVKVKNTDGQEASFNSFTYRNSPTLTAITPSWGRLSGGQTVQITGTNFWGTPKVSIGSLECTNVTLLSAGGLTCVTPSSSAEVYSDVTVINPDGQQVVLTSAFLYNSGPKITSISPTTFSTLGTETLNVTGTNFRGDSVITINEVPCTDVVFTFFQGKLTCNIPAGVNGSASIKVLNVDGQSDSRSGATQYVEPTITSITPNSSYTTGGGLVNISGSGFAKGVEVQFIGTYPITLSSCTVSSSTQLVCTVPAWPKQETIAVAVKSKTGGGTLNNAFTYNQIYIDPLPTTTPTPTPTPTLVSLTLSASSTSISGKDEPVQVYVTGTYSDNSKKTIPPSQLKWSSTNEVCLFVSQTGLVSNRGRICETMIIASLGQLSGRLGMTAPYSLICTELYRQNLLPKEIYEADSRYGKENISINTMHNYHAWSQYIVAAMRHSKLVTEMIKPLASAWAYEMAYRKGVYPESNLLGRLLLEYGVPVSDTLGGILRSQINTERVEAPENIKKPVSDVGGL